ncbi:protein disulfide isomerase-like 1-4 [Sesamum angolense]|uniref:protein disulfide-isomerase n=1 Tax=Sesamum angolense TaxID=2727404 RepID=A0AAE1XBT9_9LAMI|nr:protein disulfide isomerase-like 1-4 [Sesamum angolense]
MAPTRLLLLLTLLSLLLFSLLPSPILSDAAADDDEDLNFLEELESGDVGSGHQHHRSDAEYSDNDGEEDENYDDFEVPSDFNHEDEEDEVATFDEKDVVVLTDAAATELKGENVKLAKVDATEKNELAEKYEVQGFPTVYFFVDGEHKPYSGQRTKDAIVTWIKKKIGPGVSNITTTEDAERILTSENKVVLGFLDTLVRKRSMLPFIIILMSLSKKSVMWTGIDAIYLILVIKDSPDSEELAAASKLDDDVSFYQTANPNVAKMFHLEADVKRPALFKKSVIAEFISTNKLPLVITFSRENAPLIFESTIKKQLLLFATSNDSQGAIQTFQEAAKLFKGKLIFVYVQVDNEEVGKPVADYFGVAGDSPKVLGYAANDETKKYILDGEVTLEKIKAFGEAFLEDKLKPFYKSDPIPVTLYAPWCGHCQALEPTYNKLAKHLRGIESLVIAKMDGTTNEHPRAKSFDAEEKFYICRLMGSPQFLFPAGKKSIDPITVDTDRTVVAFYKFLKKHASIPFKLQKEGSSPASEDSHTKEGIKSSSSDVKDEL